MLLTDSTSLTEKPDVSFVDASLTNSMRQWSLSLSPWLHEPALTVTLRNATHGGRVLHSITYWTADEVNPAIQPAVVIRILCHALIDRLPEASFLELLETLRNIYEFYQEPQCAPTLPAAPVSVEAQLSRTYIRPAIEIED